MKKIIILAGSNNNNLKLANEFAKSIGAQGATAEVVNLAEVSLPVYSPLEEKKGIPENIKPYVAKMDEAYAMVMVAPEYNGGVPPLLTNFISWISRSGEEDWRQCFNGKKVAIGTHSGSGGLHCLMAMRVQLSYLGMNVLGRQIHTHYKKELNQESLNSVVEQLLS
jgi:chromate reductase